MGWTKKHLSRLRDTSPAGSPMRWVMTRDAVGSTQVGVSRFTFEPGARMPFGHRHRVQEEVYLVVGGSGTFKLDDELVPVVEGDVLRVAPETMRAYEAGPDGLDLVCVGGARPRGNDSERDHAFWD
jgi:quercetin dioxygenase-like cupin family protein